MNPVLAVLLTSLVLTVLIYLFIRKKIRKSLAIHIYFVLLLFFMQAGLLGFGAAAYEITSYLISVYVR